LMRILDSIYIKQERQLFHIAEICVGQLVISYNFKVALALWWYATATCLEHAVDVWLFLTGETACPTVPVHYRRAHCHVPLSYNLHQPLIALTALDCHTALPLYFSTLLHCTYLPRSSRSPLNSSLKRHPTRRECEAKHSYSQRNQLCLPV
jgi:hypothetical protein